MRDKRFLADTLPSEEQNIVALSHEESHHAVSVLRLKSGASVEALDGKGRAVRALLDVQGKQARLLWQKGATIRSAAPNEVVPLYLEVALTKGPAFENVIEKAVELGVSELQPIIAQHSVMKYKNQLPKWQRRADQSLKQCERLERLWVREPVTLDAQLQAKRSGSYLYFDEESAHQSKPLELFSYLTKTRPPIHALIGPEGGWSDKERRAIIQHAKCINLGPIVLKVDTAAISVAAIIGSYLRQT